MKKIYVVCPPYYVTGGTELLHQFVYKLKSISDLEVFIYYPNVDWKFEVKPIPSKFEKYILNNWTDSIKDSEENIIIFPETLANLALNFPKSIKFLWWLSVNNFYKTLNISYNDKTSIKNLLKKIIGKYPYDFLPKVFNGNLFKFHFVQSTYAKEHLLKKKIMNVFELTDYLSSDYLTANIQNKKRENIILYNPLKGFEFTKKLISSLNDYEWVPLEKKTNQELLELYSKAKLYVDFGNHPGKDRIPREAVVNGCILITSKFGSAQNDFDIPIGNEYKFNIEIDSELKRVQYTIIDILKNYDSKVSHFDFYKHQILSEESKFEIEVKLISNLIRKL